MKLYARRGHVKRHVLVRDWLGLAAMRGIAALLERIPLAWAHAFARAAARLYMGLGSRRVRWTHRNLAVAFPSWSAADRASVAFESCVNFALALLDLRRSEKWDEGQLLARFAFEGVEHLEAALSSGHGAVMLSLHMGCYDLGLRALSLRFPSLRFAVISTPQRSALLQGWLSDRRNAGVVEVIPPGSTSALRALRVVRSGRPLILLNDLYVRSGRKVEAPLFGKRCLTSTGPAVLARMAPASILPCYVLRDGPDHYIAHILPKLELPSGAVAADDENITAECNGALEDIIRKHPEHWIWAHRRFRYSPDLPSGLYRPLDSA